MPHEDVTDFRARYEEAEGRRLRLLDVLQVVERERDEARAQAEALAEALEALRVYLATLEDGTHKTIGQACGVDACIVCLAEATVTSALRSFGESPRHGSERELDAPRDHAGALAEALDDLVTRPMKGFSEKEIETERASRVGKAQRALRAYRSSRESSDAS